jgi:hypothetical protein
VKAETALFTASQRSDPLGKRIHTDRQGTQGNLINDWLTMQSR